LDPLGTLDCPWLAIAIAWESPDDNFETHPGINDRRWMRGLKRKVFNRGRTRYYQGRRAECIGSYALSKGYKLDDISPTSRRGDEHRPSYCDSMTQSPAIRNPSAPNHALPDMLEVEAVKVSSGNVEMTGLSLR
jgi:hypothetical protein